MLFVPRQFNVILSQAATSDVLPSQHCGSVLLRGGALLGCAAVRTRSLFRTRLLRCGILALRNYQLSGRTADGRRSDSIAKSASSPLSLPAAEPASRGYSGRYSRSSRILISHLLGPHLRGLRHNKRQFDCSRSHPPLLSASLSHAASTTFSAAVCVSAESRAPRHLDGVFIVWK